MKKERFIAYHDAVFAIIATIMVLALPQPAKANWESIWALRNSFFSYAISFLQLAVLWISHHNSFRFVKHVDHAVLWVNMLMLFSVSLLPYATEFVGNHLWTITAQLFYGAVWLASSLSFALLLILIKKRGLVNEEHKSVIFRRGRGLLDYGVKVLGFACVWFFPPAILLSGLIDSLIWIVPDKRDEIAV